MTDSALALGIEGGTYVSFNASIRIYLVCISLEEWSTSGNQTDVGLRPMTER